MSKISIVTVTRNRSELLFKKAYSSLLRQTSCDFEWIVINDGGDKATRELIKLAKNNNYISIIYREIDHPQKGFALCHGRNLGIELAKNELITYLDDDNALFSDFVTQMSNFMLVNSQTKFAIPLQKRSRQVWQNGDIVSQGKTFISPQVNTKISDLICHRQLFDSNGFTHYKTNAPSWNSNYRIYCDYEYFLQCLDTWGDNSFSLNSQPLVEYVQSNQGTIGQSNYGDWAKELKQILDSRSNYSTLADSLEYLSCLHSLQSRFESKHRQQLDIPAFKGGRI
jgi:glycosyltransferase involved in cell wall biosynthesis